MDDFDDIDELEAAEGIGPWGDTRAAHGDIDVVLDNEPSAEGSVPAPEAAPDPGGVHVDPMLLGTGYALYRHGQDRQAERIGAEVRATID